MYYSPFEMKPLKSLSCESLLGFVSLCLDFMNNDNSPDAIDIRICMTKAMAYELLSLFIKSRQSETKPSKDSHDKLFNGFISNGE